MKNKANLLSPFKSKGEKNSYIFIILFLLIGGLITSGYAIINHIRYTNNLENCTRKIIATVTDLEIKEEHEENDTSIIKYYYPTVSYEVLGKTYTDDSPGGFSNTEPFSLNQRIYIYYNPDNPSNYYIEGMDYDKYFRIYLTVGGFLIFFGILLIINMPKMQEI